MSHASAMTAASSALSPAVDTVTTRSAALICSSRFTAVRCRMSGALAHRERLPGAVGERLVRGQDDGSRAHALMRGINARRRCALFLLSLDRLEHAMARHDDAVVGRDQVLLGAIDDRPHALLQR